jgi:AAA15 family ATPase/GTPase
VQTDNSQWKKYGLASLFNFDDDSNSIYLKALRYISSQWGSGVDGSGEVQWKRLAQELENNNSNLKSKLNNWLKKHIGMSINLLPSIERKKKDADDDRYYDYIDFFAFIPLGSKTKLNHYQVGFGISQLIPIIFSSYFYKDRYIFLEQPEAQVHPALQSEIADVFIESAMKRGNTFIIETHSEHLIRRIMRRIRDTSKGNDKQNAITPDDVSIIYVEKKGGQSVVKTIGLDENGELKDRWPGGFFAERYDDIFS